MSLCSLDLAVSTIKITLDRQSYSVGQSTIKLTATVALKQAIAKNRRLGNKAITFFLDFQLMDLTEKNQKVPLMTTSDNFNQDFECDLITTDIKPSHSYALFLNYAPTRTSSEPANSFEKVIIVTFR